MKPSPFSRTALAALIAMALTGFVVSALLLIRQPDAPSTDGPSTFSGSLIGLDGLLEFLKRSNLEAVASRDPRATEGASHQLLVVVEPRTARLSDEDRARIAAAPRLLLVIPKLSGAPDRSHEGWLSRVMPLTEPQVEEAARLVLPDAAIRHGTPGAAWHTDRPRAVPDFSGPVQLVTSPSLLPLIGDQNGILLGKLNDLRRDVWVLADPEPLENQGLGRGLNASFALSLFDDLAAGQRIVFDEAVHGFRTPVPNPFALPFRFPYWLVTLQALIALALVLLAGGSRFGKPQSIPAPLAAGKRELLDTTAGLLDRSYHRAAILRRYVDVQMAEAARQLHAPRHLPERELAAWLQQTAGRRMREGLLDEVRRAALSRDTRQLFGAARALHEWKLGLVHGSYRPEGHRRRPQA